MRLKRYLCLALTGLLLVGSFTPNTTVRAEDDDDGSKYIPINSTRTDESYSKDVYLEDTDYIKSVKYIKSDKKYSDENRHHDSGNIEISLDSGDFIFSENGYYEVFITYDNGVEDVRRFWIDKTKPTITGLTANTEISNDLSKTFSFQVNDTTSGVKTVIVGNRTITDNCEGTYSLSISLSPEEYGDTIVTGSDGSIQYDEDGNALRETVYVTKAKYSLTVPATKDLQSNVITWDTTLDKQYKNKAQATKAIESLFKITAVDVSGNTTTKQIGWDTLSPVVSGVKSKTTYRGSKQLTVYDSRLKSVTITKKKSKSDDTGVDTTFSFNDDSEKLTITIGDVGKKSFTISDKDYADGITYKNINWEQGYKVAVRRTGSTCEFTVYKSNALIATCSENAGVSYNITNGIFSVSATDFCGNVNSSIKNVRADGTAPKIKGFTSGKTYKKSIKVTATDAVSGIKSITVNGKKISNSGKEYSKAGSYLVTATDKAGNVATKSFIIIKK